jgi:hypothetical protein
MNIREIYRDINALEKLGELLETLKLSEKEQEFFAVGFAAGFEYAKNNKVAPINDIEENPFESEYGC